MFSLGVKIQILIFLLLVFVSLYLLVLQKEVKLMQTELQIMKVNMGSQQLKDSKEQQKTCPVSSSHKGENIEVCHIPFNDGDDISVSSNDIKEILTNISQVEERPKEPVEDNRDLSQLSPSELDKLKVEDLKKYLTTHKIKFSKTHKKNDLIRLICGDEEEEQEEVISISG
jgi:hypothetical protein